MSDLETSSEPKSKQNDDSQLRVHSFAYEVYPESYDIDLLFKNLAQMGDERATYWVSPCHDLDKHDDGTSKKAHYHVQVYFRDAKKVSVGRKFGKLMNFVGCEVLHNARGYARYLCHLDDPDKAQYNPQDVKTFGPKNYIDFIGSVDDKYNELKDMIDYIKDNNIMFYSDFVDYCKENNNNWFRSLMGSATFKLEKYIRERRTKLELLHENIFYYSESKQNRAPKQLPYTAVDSDLPFVD